MWTPFHTDRPYGNDSFSQHSSVKSMFVLMLSDCCLIIPLSICFTNRRDRYIAGCECITGMYFTSHVYFHKFVALLLIALTWGDTVAVRNEIALLYLIIHKLLRSSNWGCLFPKAGPSINSLRSSFFLSVPLNYTVQLVKQPINVERVNKTVSVTHQRFSLALALMFPSLAW